MRLLTPFPVCDAATSLGSISRVKSQRPSGVCNVLSQCSGAALFPHELSDAELCLTFFFTACWFVSSDLKSNGLSGQIPDEIGDCSLLETL